jgi:hypothetical protein
MSAVMWSPKRRPCAAVAELRQPADGSMTSPASSFA